MYRHIISGHVSSGKSRRARYVARKEENANSSLVEKLLEKCPHGRPRKSKEVSIKMDVRMKACKDGRPRY
jgi:hypothetical protein